MEKVDGDSGKAVDVRAVLRKIAPTLPFICLLTVGTLLVSINENFVAKEFFFPKDTHLRASEAIVEAANRVETASSVVEGAGKALSVFVIPIYGKLSDAFGRRPMFLLTFSILTLQNGLFWLAVTHGISLYFFYAAKVLSFFAPLNAVMLSFVADCTKNEERGVSFSLVLGAVALFTVAPLLAVKYSDLRTVSAGSLSLIAFLLTASCVVYVFFCVSESLPLEKRRPFSLFWQDIDPRHSLRILGISRTLRRQTKALAVAVFSLFMGTAVSGQFMLTKFNFITQQDYLASISTVQLVNFSASMFVQMVFLPLALRQLSEMRAAIVFISITLGAFVLQALSPSFTVFCIGVAAVSFSSAISPCCVLDAATLSVMNFSEAAGFILSGTVAFRLWNPLALFLGAGGLAITIVLTLRVPDLPPPEQLAPASSDDFPEPEPEDGDHNDSSSSSESNSAHHHRHSVDVSMSGLDSSKANYKLLDHAAL